MFPLIPLFISIFASSVTEWPDTPLMSAPREGREGRVEIYYTSLLHSNVYKDPGPPYMPTPRKES